MRVEFQIIKEKLREEGIEIDLGSLKENADQGFMSTVFIVDSDQGELVIHLARPGSEWIRQKIWEKLRGVGDILKNYPELPVSPVFLSGQIDDQYFFVQKKLSGQPTGKRGISSAEVVDTWFDNASATFVPQIQELLARVHAIPCEGYGILAIREGKLEGRYSSWEEFFSSEIPRWLEGIEKGDSHTDNSEEAAASLQSAEAYAKSFLSQVPSTNPSLVHGDAINPSNVLVQGEKITGLIDWEWSLFGDPAWEFCDPGWWPYVSKESLQPYFNEVRKHAPIDEDEFIRRIHLYVPLWIMWGCNLHSENPEGSIYKVLRVMLANVLHVEK